MTLVHSVTDSGNITPKGDTNPWAFDDTPVYTLFNAMSAIAHSTFNLLGDQTALIQGIMAYSANLIGPLSNSWSNQWQKILNGDEAEIAYYAGQKDQEGVSTWSNQMNVDNSAASQTSTGFNNILSSNAQQSSSMTSNYQNISQLSNTIATGLWTAINQNWVI